MIYITGDCHGDYRRFENEIFPEQLEMTKNDYVIIAGDFGFWNDDSRQNDLMNWLTERPFTLLWVDGNHENYDLLSKYPVEKWHGGDVQFIKPSVIHLRRGQIYDINGCVIFIFGGASSHDISGGILEVNDPFFDKKRKRLDRLGICYRVNHLSWWKEEMPNDKEFQEGFLNLKKRDNRVDYIVSHCCSTSTQAMMSAGLYQADRLTHYFEDIKRTVNYKRWFFGHYHDNRCINDKEILLYEQIIRIW